MSPPSVRPGQGQRGSQRSHRAPGRACSGQDSGASRPTLQRCPLSWAVLSSNPHLGPRAGVQARSSLTSSPHPGLLPGSGERPRFFCPDTTPRLSTPALEGSGAGMPRPASAQSGTLASRPGWEALCSGCPPPGPAGSAAGTLPDGHDRAQKQGVTMVHVGADKRREGRGPGPGQLASVSEDPDIGQLRGRSSPRGPQFPQTTMPS